MGERGRVRPGGHRRCEPGACRGWSAATQTGAPTGVLHEAAATLLDRAIPAPTGAARTAALDRYAATLAALGVTGVHDPADLAVSAALDGPELYRALAADGRLPLRVTCSVREVAARGRHRGRDAHGCGRRPIPGWLAQAVRGWRPGIAQRGPAGAIRGGRPGRPAGRWSVGDADPARGLDAAGRRTGGGAGHRRPGPRHRGRCGAVRARCAGDDATGARGRPSGRACPAGRSGRHPALRPLGHRRLGAALPPVHRRAGHRGRVGRPVAPRLPARRHSTAREP